MSSPSASDRIVQAPLASSVFRFGAPLALGMALQTTFNLVDAYLISRLDAEVAGPSLGAIGICDQIAAVGSIVSYGISTATAALVAQYEGRGDRESARRVAWQSMIMVSLWSALFGVLGLAGAGFIMHDVVGAKGQVAELGTAYLRVMLGGSFSIFFLLQVTTIQRALGSSKTPVAMLLLSNVLNLVLAVLLVYGPGEAPAVFSWGPPLAEALHLPRMRLLGAAWATILARIVTLCPLLYLVIRRFGLFGRGARGGLDRKTAREIFDIAWPSSTQLVMRIIAMLAVHALVARHFTSQTDQSATTALGIVFRLETMALFVGLGWGSAAQTFVGQNIGAGQERRAAQSGWLAAAYNLCAMFLLVLAYRRYGASIVSFFDEDANVVKIALGYLAVVAPSYLALGLGIVLGSAMTGAGATRITMFIDLAVICFFQVPCAIAVTSLYGASEVGLWFVVAATNCLGATVYALSYRRGTFLRRALPA
ncbi:MAG: MATE family efflux transporter [Polyangiaceae bacterium]